MEEFTDSELEILAGFVCERYDMLEGIVNDPNPKMRKDFRDGSKKAIVVIESLNSKLRPYYVKGKYN